MRTITLAAAMAVVLSAAGAFAAEAEGESVALTVYNDGNAIVKERRFIDVPQGGGEIRFTEVAKTIDPTSVTFRSITDPDAAILEQNYEYDLVSASKILQKYIGMPISVTTADGTAVEGTLMSFSDEDLVVSGSNLSVIQRNENIKSLSVGKLPEGLILEPTLMWLLSSEKGGRQLAEVAYSAGGCGWNADYIAILDEADTALDLSGWVTLRNQSGRTYENARLKLVAGEVHRTDEYERGGSLRSIDMIMYDERAFQEKALAEYHLYTLPRPTTVKDNQVKQIELLNAAGVPVESKKYLFDLLADFQPWWGGGPFTDDFSVEEKGKVRVYVIFRNDEKSHLGMPLPAGRVRFFKRDGKDLEFVGEDKMEHTPKDEKVELLMGSAFDLAGERTRTDFSRGEGERWMEESFKITLRNHKEQPVTVNAREHMFRWVNWEVTAKSAEFEKLDARTVQFPVQLAPDEEKTVTYTVRYTW